MKISESIYLGQWTASGVGHDLECTFGEVSDSELYVLQDTQQSAKPSLVFLDDCYYKFAIHLDLAIPGAFMTPALAVIVGDDASSLLEHVVRPYNRPSAALVRWMHLPSAPRRALVAPRR